MGAARIHPTALVAPEAQLAADVMVGAYSMVGPRVRIGARRWSVRTSSLKGGPPSVRAPTSSSSRLSVPLPQDLKYRGEDSALVIGDDNCIREFCTLQPGTAGGGMLTRLGHGNLLMNYSHIAHDCVLGDRTIVANGAQLGGHVVIEDCVVIGALSGIHQFVRLGESAIIGAGSMVSQDVPPFCNATGDRARLHGLNSIGLKRRGLRRDVSKR